MKKKLAKLCIFALLIGLLTSLSAPAQAAEGKPLRIGLRYDSSVVNAGQLTNVAGSGFRFGYFDKDLTFQQLGWTMESDVTVLWTQNTYLSAMGAYSSTSEGSVGAVGCYHVALPGTYADFDSARAQAGQVNGGFVTWIGGVYTVRMGSYLSKAAATEAAANCGIEGAVMGETTGYGYSVVTTGTANILFQFDGETAGEERAFGVQPSLEAGVKPVTKFQNGNQYYGSFRFERIDGGKLTVVNIVELEDYIKGILPYEMSASWPLEALKAQAVAARTYSMGLGGNRHGGSHFDICTTTHCQVYRGTGSANENSDRAVDETAGQLIYYNGKHIGGGAVYYSSNGGGTESSKNVWGTNHPYLVGKEDPYEADIADKAGNYKWTKTYTAESLKARLHDKGKLCGDIVSFCISEVSPSGNVIGIRVVDDTGKAWNFTRASVREILNINSIRFTLSVSGGTPGEGGYAIAGAGGLTKDLTSLYAINGDGEVAQVPQDAYAVTATGVEQVTPTEGTPTGSGVTYTLTGTGWGHNVGMSQWGAYAMAKRGMSYMDILTFYYTGITVE